MFDGYGYGQQLQFDEEFEQERDTQLSTCSDNPCLNEATCQETSQGGFFCLCPWGWTGRSCEICLTECASNPCPSNKKCRAKYGGGFDCICAADRTGANCEIQNDACSINPCLNAGKCKPELNGLYTCVCKSPFAGINCEERWNNPCTEDVLRSLDVIQFKYPWDDKKYIVCTDIDEWVAMACSDGTRFNELLGHCVQDGYEAPVCPVGLCFNDGDCFADETGSLGCVCKTGFTGQFCETDIDDCKLNGNACGGGMCVDQINTYYCICPTGVGLDCRNTMPDPCTEETSDALLAYYPIGTQGFHYLHCTGVGSFQVRKCAGGLYWNQEERTCTLDKPMTQSGICTQFPCQNAGHCLDLGGSQFRCVCKEGYTGQLCENKIDYCASNPCMNGGRCLSYPGGYTCVCPDKLIDDCCCNGKKEIIIIL
jgi:hypothetical protein